MAACRSFRTFLGLQERGFGVTRGLIFSITRKQLTLIADFIVLRNAGALLCILEHARSLVPRFHVSWHLITRAFHRGPREDQIVVCRRDSHAIVSGLRYRGARNQLTMRSLRMTLVRQLLYQDQV